MDDAEIRRQLVPWWNFAREYVRTDGDFDAALAKCGQDSTFGTMFISRIVLAVQKRGIETRDFYRFAAMMDEHITHPDSTTTMTDLRVAMKQAFLMLMALDIDPTPNVEWSRWMGREEAARALGCKLKKKTTWLKKHIDDGTYRADTEGRQRVRLDLSTVPQHLRDKLK